MDKIRSSEITSKTEYLNRRDFIRAGATALAAGSALAIGPRLFAQQGAPHGRKLTTVRSALSTSEAPNTWEHITTHNNYYEFEPGAGNGPSRLARNSAFCSSSGRRAIRAISVSRKLPVA